MDPDFIFTKTLDDLKIKSSSNDMYEVFMSSVLMRKLLLDSTPLMDKVNRHRALKIKFLINRRKPPEDQSLVFWSIQDGFDPETGVPHLGNSTEVNRDELLSAPVIKVKNDVISVKDLIKFLCNVKGSVHQRDPRTSKENALSEIEQFITVGGMPSGVRTMKAISRVVLKGLAPLRDKILDEKSPA